MKLSNMLIRTLKEVPSDAETPSHQLMLRTSCMRKLASGIYNYLPFGYRAIRKVEQIVRDEMDAIGSQELLMPALNPAELWQESGRWETMTGVMFRLKDKHNRDFCLGTTHEEVITDIVRNEVRSYRELPLFLYQIQTKFRDEPRPRAGVIRAREFIMKDLYSFHSNIEDLELGYQKVYDAYVRIFKRCGLEVMAVEADSGAIGGSESHEFMLLSEWGEDTVILCPSCGYAANNEKAEFFVGDKGEETSVPPLEVVHTPNAKTIEEVTAFLGEKSSCFIKTLIYKADNQPVVVLVRGDREINPLKLQKILKSDELDLADEEMVVRVTKTPVGFAGPVGLEGVRLIADLEVANMQSAVVGANNADHHYKNAKIGRDFSVKEYADIRLACEGDLCKKCRTPLIIKKGIEVGHTFKLGTKYSHSLNATFSDENGELKEIIMGCYGLGVSRTIAAVIEQCSDKDGIMWPMTVAPYHVIILLLNASDEKQREIASELYEELKKEKIEVIFDDREFRAGVKFKDADLLGIPLRLTVGNKATKDNIIELRVRKTGENINLSKEEVTQVVKNKIQEEISKLNNRE